MMAQESDDSYDRLKFRNRYTKKDGTVISVWSDPTAPPLEYFDHAVVLTPEPIDINRWLFNRSNKKKKYKNGPDQIDDQGPYRLS